MKYYVLVNYKEECERDCVLVFGLSWDSFCMREHGELASQHPKILVNIVAFEMMSVRDSHETTIS